MEIHRWIVFAAPTMGFVGMNFCVCPKPHALAPMHPAKDHVCHLTHFWPPAALPTPQFGCVGMPPPTKAFVGGVRGCHHLVVAPCAWM
jgi:hypothetical protein